MLRAPVDAILPELSGMVVDRFGQPVEGVRVAVTALLRRDPQQRVGRNRPEVERPVRARAVAERSIPRRVLEPLRDAGQRLDAVADADVRIVDPRPVVVDDATRNVNGRPDDHRHLAVVRQHAVAVEDPVRPCDAQILGFVRADDLELPAAIGRGARPRRRAEEQLLDELRIVAELAREMTPRGFDGAQLLQVARLERHRHVRPTQLVADELRQLRIEVHDLDAGQRPTIDGQHLTREATALGRRVDVRSRFRSGRDRFPRGSRIRRDVGALDVRRRRCRGPAGRIRHGLAPVDADDFETENERQHGAHERQHPLHREAPQENDHGNASTGRSSGRLRRPAGGEQRQQRGTPGLPVAELVVEPRPHALEPALELRAHRVHGAVETFGDLPRLEVVEEAEQHHGVIRLVELEQLVDEALVRGRALRGLGRIVARVVRASGHRFGGDRCLTTTTTTVLATKPARGVLRDPREPTLGIGQRAGRPRHGLEHRLLRDVVGARRIGHEAARERADPVLVGEQSGDGRIGSGHGVHDPSAAGPRADSRIPRFYPDLGQDLARPD